MKSKQPVEYKKTKCKVALQDYQYLEIYCLEDKISRLTSSKLCNFHRVEKLTEGTCTKEYSRIQRLIPMCTIILVAQLINYPNK